MRATLWGALSAGLLDLTDALLVYGVRGVSPLRILQSIASGLLGRGAYSGGLATASLGIVLHFLIALILAALYAGASQRLPALTRRPLWWGSAYGLAAYLVMNAVVLPLSAVVPRPALPPLPLLVNGVLAHVLLVGIPIALFASRGARVICALESRP